MDRNITIEEYSTEKEELAFQEFLYLIATDKVPKESMFFSGSMTISSSNTNKTYEEIPIQLVVLPDKKHKLLNSATNTDLVMQEFPKFSDKSVRISLKGEVKQLSSDKEGRILMKNLTFQLSPDETGFIAELRTEKKKSSPIETILQIKSDRITILDFQEYIDIMDNLPLNFTVKDIGTYTLREVIESDAFQEYLNKLVDGELPQGTAFLFISAHVQHETVVENPIFLARAELPDGTEEQLQEKTTTLLNQFAQHGATIKTSKTAKRIDLSELRRCPECEEKFTPKRKNQVYCTTKCGDRVRAREYRARKKIAKAQTP